MAKLDSRKQKSSSQHERHIKSISQVLNHPRLDSNFIQRAQANLPALHPTDIMMLQRTMGNQAVLRLLDDRGKATVNGAGRSAPTAQRKLKVGAANDSYEHEADQVARQMVGAPQSIPSAARTQPQGLVQRQGQGSFAAGGDFESRLNQTKGSGQALPEKMRAEFEPKFGADLSGVRIHTNSDSNALNRQIQARAFTHGSDIHFSQGAYNPHSSEGRQILAHELTHTIQQTGGSQLQRKSNGIQRSHTLTPAPDTTIQRLTITSDALANSESMSSKFMGFFGKSSDPNFELLKKSLNTYPLAKIPQDKLSVLKAVKYYARRWLYENKAEAAQGSAKSTMIGRLLGEVLSEIRDVIEQMQAQAQAGQQNQGAQQQVQVPAPQPVMGGVVDKGHLADPGDWRYEGDPDTWKDQVGNAGGEGMDYEDVPEDPEHEAYADELTASWDNPFKYLSRDGYNQVRGISDSYDYDPTDPIQGNNPWAEAAKDVMRRNKLTRAEGMAIGLYSAGDYLYINPAFVKSSDWMKSGLVDKEIRNKYQNFETNQKIQEGQVTDQHVDEATKEGERHSKFLLSGLKKLPDCKEYVWRGTGLTAGEFATRFRKNGKYVVNAFTSTSKNKGKALDFVNKAKKEGKVPILLHMNLKEGKDITKLAFHDEAERLVLPGSEFDVLDITDTPEGYKLVELDQVPTN